MVSSNVTIGENDYEISRLRLKEWLYLEEAKLAIKDAIDKKDRDVLVASIFKYLSIAFSDCGIVWDTLPWLDVYVAFVSAQEVNQLQVRLPMLIIQSKNDKKQPWEYSGRMWYRWAHIFASQYGWDMNKIATLEPDDAVSLLQEIIVDEQLDREWEWSLTEIAYPYNENSKKSEFQPLERPEWMVVKTPTEIKKIRIRKDMLPIGNVIRLGEDA